MKAINSALMRSAAKHRQALSGTDALEQSQRSDDQKVTDMLRPKIDQARALHGTLKGVDHGAYNISDFFKKDLPQLRTLTDRIRKQKQQLEATLFQFVSKAEKEMKKRHTGG